MNWLARYIDPHGKNCHRSLCRVGGYVVATDGYSLLAVLDTLDGSEAYRQAQNLHDRPKQWKWPGRVIDVAGEPQRADATTATLGDLWAWLDRVEREVCPLCRGSGLVYADDGVRDGWREPIVNEPTVQCYGCRGARWIFPLYEDDRDTVLFDHVAVERNRVAYWLPAELGDPSDSVAYQTTPIGPSKKNELPWVTFFGPSWKLIVAGIQPDSTYAASHMHYRKYVPGAGQWWECRRSAAPAVHPGTDWFIEQGFQPFDFVRMWGVTE